MFVWCNELWDIYFLLPSDKYRDMDKDEQPTNTEENTSNIYLNWKIAAMGNSRWCPHFQIANNTSTC